MSNSRQQQERGNLTKPNPEKKVKKSFTRAGLSLMVLTTLLGACDDISPNIPIEPTPITADYHDPEQTAETDILDATEDASLLPTEATVETTPEEPLEIEFSDTSQLDQATQDNLLGESTEKTSSATILGTNASDTELKEIAWNFLDHPYHNSKVEKEMLRIETQKITTIETTPLIFIPLHEDFLLDETADLQVIPVRPGMEFQVSNLVSIKTSNEVVLKLGLVDNTYNYYQTGVSALLIEICDYTNNYMTLLQKPEL